MFEEGFASDEYKQSLRQGYAGIVADELDDRHYTVQGVVENPQIAADYGRVIHEDIVDRANRQLGEPEKGKRKK